MTTVVARRHIETVATAVATASLIAIGSAYVHAQSDSSVLKQRTEQHEKRLDAIEAALEAVGRSNERIAATQQMIAKVVDRLEARSAGRSQ